MLLPKRNLLLGLCSLVFLLFTSTQVFAQSVVIEGTVVSSTDNKPLSGVSIVEQGSTKGTATKDDGTFTLSVSKAKATLVFTSVGFKPYTLTLNGTNASAITVKLESTVSALDDVVVVGYGTQKKVNQTGSTQTLKLDDAVNQPVTNAGQLMYGKFTGVQITQGSGLPGADASNIIIRGVGTFGNTTPLVVIDNIQYSGLDAFNNLSPADIETISVLKDASASAIYGARGANGVIVVVTKKGKSGVGNIIYNSYYGLQQVTVVPEYLNAEQYATLKNERDINFNGPTAAIRYSNSDIQTILDGSNPDQYSNTNWAKEILRTAPIMNQYLAFSGGGDKTTYRVSLGYLNQEAVVRGKFKSERFTINANLNSKLNSWLTVSNVMNAYWSKFKGPTGGASAITGETGIINQFQRSAPTVAPYYSNGDWGIVDGSYQKVNASLPITNPLRRGMLGDHQNDEINIAERFSVKADITKNISFETSGSINLYYNSVSNFTPRNATRDWAGVVIAENLNNALTNSTNFNYRLLNENLLRYAKKFNNNKHDVSVLLGHSVIYNRNDGFSGSLENFPTDGLQEFNAGGVLNPNVSGGANEEAIQSFFARVNYVLDGKYMFEANLRRDGSSRFASSNRYANFPSASAGWRISEEKFLSGVKWLNDLKLRASWGITGNDNIGNYLFSQNYNIGVDYFLGNQIVSGAALTTLANQRIRWETIDQFDIGIDAGFFKNRLQFTADYFRRNSYDLLYSNFPIPSTIGVTNLAALNAASMLNAGTELNLSWRNNTKKFNYSINASATIFADNKVTGLGDRGRETISGETIIQIGAPFNAIYGYKVLGVFQTAADVAAAPRQFGSVRTAPGDFQYADLSGPNGTPDGIIDAFDRTVIGNPFPKLIYSVNGTLNYQGLDMSATFEGVSRVERLMNDNGQLPFEGDRNNSLSYWINRWTPEKPSTTLPRLGGQNNAVISDFYVEDISYLRLRNIEIGYTIPGKLLNKRGISKLRVYVSGQNILTFTKFKNFDPERQRGGNTDQQVPLYKVYTFGLNLKL
jgi:TonB-linked SusC/RagA family outer membrane protein